MTQVDIPKTANQEFCETSTDASANTEKDDASTMQFQNDMANEQDYDAPKTFSSFKKKFMLGLLRKPFNAKNLVNENLPETSISDDISTGKVHFKYFTHIIVFCCGCA